MELLKLVPTNKTTLFPGMSQQIFADSECTNAEYTLFFKDIYSEIITELNGLSKKNNLHAIDLILFYQFSHKYIDQYLGQIQK